MGHDDDGARREGERGDLSALRRRLAGRRGRAAWRSLEELADEPAAREWMEREFPRHAAAWPDGMSRRRFLELSAASLALGGLTACRQPTEEIVPYVRQPEEVVPGRPLHYATALTIGGRALGVLVESHLGRPTKVEGNPQHPASLGATDVYRQAAILDLYDPDRAQVIRHLGRIRPWSSFRQAVATAMARLRPGRGRGLRILTPAITSPTLLALLERTLESLPEARWHRHEPAGREAVEEGARLAFGRVVEPRHHLRDARVVLALDSDFATTGTESVRLARELMDGRRLRTGAREMNRLWVAEPTPTGTGAVADQRLPVRASELPALTSALAAELRVPGARPAPLSARQEEWVRAVSAELLRHRGRGVVLAGDWAAPEVQAVVHAINDRIGATGRTVSYGDPLEPLDELKPGSLEELVDDMRAGDVELLMIVGANPAHDAPAGLDFASALLEVATTVHVGAYPDETAELCQWNVPLAHELESWGDARAPGGLVTIQQPLIEPLYAGRTPVEILALLGTSGEQSARQLVRAHWEQEWSSGFEDRWRKSLHDGFVEGTSLPERALSADAGRATAALADLVERTETADLELVFRPDDSIHDGRFANNGWLQELPRPITKLTWDNAALLAPSTAESLGVEAEDLLELEVDGRTLEVAAWIVPGAADRSITLHLGHGRRRGGRVAVGTGFDAYAVRPPGAPWLATGVTVRRTGRKYRLASTQHHHALDEGAMESVGVESEEAAKRHLVTTATLERFLESPDVVHEHHHEPEHSLYREFAYDGHAWAMAIDLTACTGCNACVVACQAENNIPVVGKEQVLLGREMHWIRVDRYFASDLDEPSIELQPLTCMHCEKAPCEVVCPVAATVHGDEGLNQMIYNRCVGTRYCSNNCPYKVRRFNFLSYVDDAPVEKLMRNPDVTVRARGVMEKCTYCVQRIKQGRREAATEGRDLRDGDVVSACQQACPSVAIAFGDANDPGSEVSRWKSSPLDYSLLAELNTRPRTTYLARIRNPSPLLSADDRSTREGEEGHG